MALVLKLSRNSVSAASSSMIITDATGNYDATTNPSGYGSPNANRNTLALFLRVYNKRYDGDSSLSNTLLTIASYDPTTVTQWTSTLNKDGWQQATVYGLKLYSTSTLFAVNDLVYNTSTSEIWRIDSVSGSGPYTYTHTVMNQIDLENTLYGKAYLTVLDTYAIPSISDLANRAIKNYFNLIVDPSSVQEDIDEAKEDADELDLLITAITYGFEYGYMAEAQKQVESAENVCID
jgi:hypothetical protein